VSAFSGPREVRLKPDTTYYTEVETALGLASRSLTIINALGTDMPDGKSFDLGRSEVYRVCTV